MLGVEGCCVTLESRCERARRLRRWMPLNNSTASPSPIRRKRILNPHGRAFVHVLGLKRILHWTLNWLKKFSPILCHMCVLIFWRVLFTHSKSVPFDFLQKLWNEEYWSYHKTRVIRALPIPWRRVKMWVSFVGPNLQPQVKTVGDRTWNVWKVGWLDWFVSYVVLVHVIFVGLTEGNPLGGEWKEFSKAINGKSKEQWGDCLVLLVVLVLWTFSHDAICVRRRELTVFFRNECNRGNVDRRKKKVKATYIVTK